MGASFPPSSGLRRTRLSSRLPTSGRLATNPAMTTHRFTPTVWHNVLGTLPPALRIASGDTIVTEKADIAITQQAGSLVQMPAGTKLADVVKALNALGATPQDLLAILQAMKTAGALNAELEVI